MNEHTEHQHVQSQPPELIPEVFDVNVEECMPHTPHSTVPMGSQLAIALALLGGLFGVSYIPWLDLQSKEPSAVEKSLRNEAKPPTTTEQLPAVETAVPEPKIQATAAFIWDIRHQRALYNKNASAQLPLASLTKLMTSLVALETLGTDAQVPMTMEAILQDGPSDFQDGELLGAKQLSDFSLISSSNDGSYALAAAASLALDGSGSTTKPFIDAMNKRADELGLTQTYFVNPTGLDQSPNESGGYGSARDMAFLVEYLVKKRPEIVLPSTAEQGRVIGSTPHTATNTNDIVDEIPGILATKTGYTDLAGGNLVVAFNAGLDRPIAIAVLGSTRQGRFTDMEELIRYAQAKITEEK
jgi:D-alanyl-D-alanine carboxypeptidase (penicillin-binding protein 5/6)